MPQENSARLLAEWREAKRKLEEKLKQAGSTYHTAMLKADRRRESTMNKADARMAATMKAAYEELLQERPAQLAQLGLLEEIAV